MQRLELNWSVSILDASAGKSSLLIPESELGYWRSQCKHYGSRSAYFGMLARNYLPHLPLLKKELGKFRNPNWNTVFQKKGLDLQKKNFSPDARDWEKFRHAAFACGVSICFLFVILMQLEAAGFFKKFGKKYPVGRNSLPRKSEKSKKFIKFSKFERVLDLEEQILHRRIQLG